LNLLLLLGVTVVPFPTALLAAHADAADRTVAAAVFNGTYVVLAVFFNVLWHHAVHRGLLDSATMESADSVSKQICSWTNLLSGVFWTYMGQRPCQFGRQYCSRALFRNSAPESKRQARAADAYCHKIVA